MSVANPSAADVDAVVFTKTIIVRTWSFLLIGLGTIGHPLSIYVFIRPALRSNPCVRYFLAATISGVFVTYVNTPLRLLLTGYTIDVFGYSLASCKILTFLLVWARAQTSWYIALASVDRFLCSSRSATLRAWSTIRVATGTIIISTIVVGLLYAYVPILYDLKSGRFKCPASQGPYPSFNGIWSLIIFSTGPPLVMVIFGSLTIRHIQEAVRRVEPQKGLISKHRVTVQPRRPKTTDGQLIRMMIFQAAYFSLTALPVSINWIYTSVKPTVASDALEMAKDDMIAQIIGTVSITGATTSFYVFVWSSRLFRDEFRQLFGRQRLLQQQQQHTNILDRNTI